MYADSLTAVSTAIDQAARDIADAATAEDLSAAQEYLAAAATLGHPAAPRTAAAAHLIHKYKINRCLGPITRRLIQLASGSPTGDSSPDESGTSDDHETPAATWQRSSLPAGTAARRQRIRPPRPTPWPTKSTTKMPRSTRSVPPRGVKASPAFGSDPEVFPPSNV